MRKNLSLSGVAVLTALSLTMGCEQIQPKITVNLKVVEACDAEPGPLQSVNTMQLIAESGEEVKSISASKGSNSATLGGLGIADGTEVFVNGFGGATPEGTPEAAGASAPIDLKSYQDSKAFPGSPLPARQYPEAPAGQTANVSIIFGRVDTFGGTTKASDGTCSALITPRHGHTATWFGQAGKVLIIGGLTYASDGTETFVPRDKAIEFYDPNTGEYSAVALPNASHFNLMQRAFHTATALPDGTVLVYGGVGSQGSGDSVAPTAFSFRVRMNGNAVDIQTIGLTEGFQNRRFHHQATLTARGDKLIFTGGCGCTGELSRAQVFSGMCPKASEEATCQSGKPRVSAIDEITIDADDKPQLRAVGAVLGNARAFHTATAVPFELGDLIVVAGGDDGTSPIEAVELLSKVGGLDWKSQAGTPLGTSRVTHAASVMLPREDCRLLIDENSASDCVLLTGGCLSAEDDGTCSDGNVFSGSTIIYDLPPATTTKVVSGPSLLAPRSDHQAFFLPSGDNMVLVAGGRCAAQNCEVGGGIVAGELLDRDDGGPRPFAKAVQRNMVRTRFASATLPSGQILMSGGEALESATTARASEGTGDLFFFPFKTISR